jgi:hypothetical protein
VSRRQTRGDKQLCDLSVAFIKVCLRLSERGVVMRLQVCPDSNPSSLLCDSFEDAISSEMTQLTSSQSAFLLRELGNVRIKLASLRL